MTNNQQHGIIWENEISKIILNDHGIQKETKEAPTAKWDIPSFPDTTLDIPTSVKAKNSNSFNCNIENGSAIRTFQTNIDFQLAYVIYSQKEDYKIVTSSEIIMVPKQIWSIMKGNLSAEVIQRLETKLKTFGLGHHVAARKWAKKIKTRYLSKFNTDFSLGFKIDSKKQRRIQASFKLSDLCNHLNMPLPKNNNIGVSNLKSGRRSMKK